MNMPNEMPMEDKVEGEAPAPAEGNDLKGGSNPVVDAVKTLMLFVSAMQDQGNPNAPAMTDALQKFAQALSGGAPAPGAKPEEEDEEEDDAPPMGPEAIKGQPQGAVKASKQVPVL